VALSVTPNDHGLGFGSPARLFSLQESVASSGSATGVGNVYDVWPDGQRFVVAEPVSAQSDVKLTVALNWMNDLKK
jgi:hypothetical protein